jgi:hypothetical protein
VLDLPAEDPVYRHEIEERHGKTIAEIADCNEHRKWRDGRIDVRDPHSGEWRTVKSAEEKSA